MTESSHTRPLSTDWQMLGEFELVVGSPADSALHTWLTELLAPLSLHSDFLNKVLRSAQESTTRTLQQNTEMASRHVHLSIFAPHQYPAKNRTWGFFRIEKMDGPDQPREHPDHAVEVYLYLEG